MKKLVNTPPNYSEGRRQSPGQQKVTNIENTRSFFVLFPFTKGEELTHPPKLSISSIVI